MSDSKEQKSDATPQTITSAEQARIDSAVNAAVKSAISGVFESLGPVLEKIALTPEKLRESMKPYVDPATIAREIRERQHMKEQDAENRLKIEARQKNCSHKDGNEKWSLSLVHNFPDRNPRGVCPICNIFIHPAEWRIAAPGDPRYHARKDHCYIEPEHPLYGIVRGLESRS